MSRALALMRFNDTGTILMGIYNGTVDCVYPRMFPCEYFYNKEEDCYDIFNKEYNCLNAYIVEVIEKEATDVEIYSDYGGGFFWDGKAVESCGYILPHYRNPFYTSYSFYEDCDEIDVCDGVPEWAEDFLKNVLGYEGRYNDNSK